MPTARVQQILLAAGAAERLGTTLPEVLCAACAAALPVTGVGLILMSDEGPVGLVAATDGPAATMEELQFTLGEGPCVDASMGGRPVLQPQLRMTAPDRWPGFGPAALDAGIEAIFAFPLQVGRIRLGVLDLYRDVPGTLTPAELGEALAFADAATRVLLHLQDQMPLDAGLHPDLGARANNRPEVHQATGMISVQAAVGLTEALLLLRARAYSSERSILEVARDVVARRLRFPPESEDHD
ncbi:MAG: GAF and ANTAR domain-containing protein [Pedococcus sp.]